MNIYRYGKEPYIIIHNDNYKKGKIEYDISTDIMKLTLLTQEDHIYVKEWYKSIMENESDDGQLGYSVETIRNKILKTIKEFENV